MQPRTGAPLRIAFITVGDLSRQTGGYLYHAQVHARLRDAGHTVNELVLSPDATWDAQRACDAASADAAIAQADVVLVDALACLAAAPALPRWHAERLMVAMVHELPTIADPALSMVPDIVAAEQTLLNHADHVVTVSAANAALLLERGVAPERISIAAPGSDRMSYAPLDTRFDTHPDLSEEHVHALCVAQWIPRKGIDVLVRAWKQASAAPAAEYSDPGMLHLVGERHADPAYTAEIDALIGDDASIIVHGALSDDDLQVLWYHMHIFVLPSRAEGYGMVFAEALLHAVPVIATNVGPIPDIVGDAGVLVPVDDVDALAAVLRDWMDDRGGWHVRGELAADRSRHLPRWSDTAAAVENALATATLLRHPPTP